MNGTNSFLVNSPKQTCSPHWTEPPNRLYGYVMLPLRHSGEWPLDSISLSYQKECLLRDLTQNYMDKGFRVR